MDSFTIACDKMFIAEGKTYFVEAMFSDRFQLANDLAEIVVRIHPAKKTVFEHLHRENLQEKPGAEKNIIEFNVNKLTGGGESFPYSRLRGVNSKKVVREIEVEGFDNNANPVIRELDNGSLRVVFCNLPPVSYIGDSEFDMDDFGSKLLKASKAQIVWEDRDIFYVSHPFPETIDQIQQFIQNYSTAKSKAPSAINASSDSKTPFCERAIAYIKASIPNDGASEAAMTLNMHFSRLVDNLLTFHVVDDPQGLVFIQDHHLEAEAISTETLHEIGQRNLRSLLQKDLKVNKMGDIFAISVDGNFEASTLVLDELWDQQLRNLITNTYIVAAPSRDVLAFCDSQSLEGIKTLQEVIRRVYTETENPNYLLSQDLYQRIDGKWVKFSAEQIQVQRLENENLQKKLRANADKLRQLVKEKMNVELNYDAKSFAWINTYIDKLGEKAEVKNKESLIQLLAAFAGECFIQRFKGAWNNQSLGLMLTTCNRSINVFLLIRQQMDKELTNELQMFTQYETELAREEREKLIRKHAAAEIPALDDAVIKRYLPSAPSWVGRDPLQKLFDKMGHLLQHGRIVWATLIQANTSLFELDPKNGSVGAPAELLYDPKGDVSIEEMLPISRHILQLRSENVSDPDIKYIKDHLNAEITRLFGHVVPTSLSAKGLRMSTTWIERLYFPHGVIVLPYFPILISDSYPGLVLPVPHAFWQQELKDQWLAKISNSTPKPAPQRYVAPAELAHLQPFNLVEEGAIYFMGKDVERDYEKARLAFEKAITQGSASAYDWLAKLYDGGFGVPKDPNKAEQLRAKANELKPKQQSNPPTKSTKAETKTPEEAFKEERDKYAHDPAHQLFLDGMAFYHGIGQIRSITKARALWKESAKMGHRDSMYNLGCLYYHGELTQKNRRLSMAYFEQASKLGCKDSWRIISDRRKTLIGIFEWGFREKNLFDN